MRARLPVLLAVAQLVMGLAPVFDARGIAAADERAPMEGLDKRLRQAGEARVWTLHREKPGGQLLAQSHWLLVRSPRATGEELRFASVAEPESLRLTGAASLPWEQVDEIRVRVNSAGNGALVGGVIVGGLFTVIGVVMRDGLWGPPTPTSSIVAGAGMGFVLGALVGGVVGSVDRRWVKVYP